MTAPLLHLAIAADAPFEAGLHVTLSTALRRLGPEQAVSLHLFVSGFGARRRRRLLETIRATERPVQVAWYDPRTLYLGTARSLFGSKAAYVALHMPNVVPADRVLCLDADLLVLTDLGRLYAHDLQGRIVGGVEEGACGVREAQFLADLGYPAHAPYLNAGVLLVDAAAWRRERITQQCLAFLDAHAPRIYNGDQTVLNAVLGAQEMLAVLPPPYNVCCYPYDPTPEVTDGIVHFLGSPKPWDLFGERLHGSYALFAEHMAHTALRGYRSYLDLSPARLRRFARQVRRYRHHLALRRQNAAVAA